MRRRGELSQHLAPSEAPCSWIAHLAETEGSMQCMLKSERDPRLVSSSSCEAGLGLAWEAGGAFGSAGDDLERASDSPRS